MKPDYDITFDVDNLRFRYRIAGIGLHKDKVLLQQVKGLDYWFMPGGRCELGESARDCLKREMGEELNSEVEVGRLVWVAENFFKIDSFSHHELSLFFLVTFPENAPVLKADEILGIDQGGGEIVDVINKWHRLDRLHETMIVPPFLKAGLCNIPAVTAHIVNRE
jgi:ADP-ribose pyrophosphatase YjhB (NUDIX family)